MQAWLVGKMLTGVYQRKKYYYYYYRLHYPCFTLGIFFEFVGVRVIFKALPYDIYSIFLIKEIVKIWFILISHGYVTNIFPSYHTCKVGCLSLNTSDLLFSSREDYFHVIEVLTLTFPRKIENKFNLLKVSGCVVKETRLEYDIFYAFCMHLTQFHLCCVILNILKYTYFLV